MSFSPGLVRGVKGVGGGCGNGRWGGWTKQCSFSICIKSRSSTTSFINLASWLEAVSKILCVLGSSLEGKRIRSELWPVACSEIYARV